MEKKVKSNREADIKNKNKGTKGTNLTFDKTQVNHDKQMEDKKKKK